MEKRKVELSRSSFYWNENQVSSFIFLKTNIWCTYVTHITNIRNDKCAVHIIKATLIENLLSQDNKNNQNIEHIEKANQENS